MVLPKIDKIISEKITIKTKGDPVIKSAIRNPLLTIFLTISLVPSIYCSALESDSEECSQEILLSYFPSVFVKETLEQNKIPKEKWDSINQDLAARDKKIIEIVESKAMQMSSNPLKDPQQRQLAVKIFRDTLYENFSDVMKKNGINNEDQIHAMLEDIQQRKAKRFARCMQQHRQSQKLEKRESEQINK